MADIWWPVLVSGMRIERYDGRLEPSFQPLAASKTYIPEPSKIPPHLNRWGNTEPSPISQGAARQHGRRSSRAGSPLRKDRCPNQSTVQCQKSELRELGGSACHWSPSYWSSVLVLSPRRREIVSVLSCWINAVFLGSICPSFPPQDADVTAGRASRGLRGHRLVFTLHTGKETGNNCVTKLTRFWLLKTTKGRNLNHLFNNSTSNSALFCHRSCMC